LAFILQQFIRIDALELTLGILTITLKAFAEGTSQRVAEDDHTFLADAAHRLITQ